VFAGRARFAARSAGGKTGLDNPTYGSAARDGVGGRVWGSRAVSQGEDVHRPGRQPDSATNAVVRPAHNRNLPVHPPLNPSLAPVDAFSVPDPTVGTTESEIGAHPAVYVHRDGFLSASPPRSRSCCKAGRGSVCFGHAAAADHLGDNAWDACFERRSGGL
jgi:hypothetical protein